MKQKHTTYKKSKGFSLIELMIAMVIGLLMMLGAMGLFTSNKRIYRELNSMVVPVHVRVTVRNSAAASRVPLPCGNRRNFR